MLILKCAIFISMLVLVFGDDDPISDDSDLASDGDDDEDDDELATEDAPAPSPAGHRVVRYDLEEFKCKANSFMTRILKLLLPHLNDPPSDARINLQLFTRSRPRTIIAENGRVVNLSGSGFRSDRKSVVIVHGFLGSGDTDWIADMVSAYLKYEDVNVILVDWSIFSKTINYVKAARNTIAVATQASALLKGFVEVLGNNSTWQPIHLIGFSLGAHIAGMIANSFKAKSVWPIGRITGLDPAAPCFAGNEMALDKFAAPFVDVIHTNGRRKFGATFGILKAIGHIDFYVNGGELQPGCKSSKLWSILRMLSLSRKIRESACSHTRAAEYFIESLETARVGKGWPLTGVKWDGEQASALAYVHNRTGTRKCIPMGITASKPKNPEDLGQYFVATASTKPFYEIHSSDREKITKILLKTLKEQ